MSIEIKEVVKSLVIRMGDTTAHARITKSFGEVGKYHWDLSHHYRRDISEGGKAVIPERVSADSPELAIRQMQEYLQGYEPWRSLDVNRDYL